MYADVFCRYIWGTCPTPQYQKAGYAILPIPTEDYIPPLFFLFLLVSLFFSAPLRKPKAPPQCPPTEKILATPLHPCPLTELDNPNWWPTCTLHFAYFDMLYIVIIMFIWGYADSGNIRDNFCQTCDFTMKVFKFWNRTIEKDVVYQ